MTHSFDCPYCNHDCEVESGDLPAKACDDIRYECENCGREMNIGWYAEVEVRSYLADTEQTEHK